MVAILSRETKIGATAPAVTPYAWFVLVILGLTYILNFLDRQLMSILAEPIRTELGLTDAQLGRLGGIYFALFYTVIGIPVGWLADRGNRVRILGLACLIWSVATAACGLARTYPMLAVGRMAVGVGEAGGAPPSYSIISDYFPAHRRGAALALFSLGVPAGQALGVAFGATIADLYDWRMAFVSLGVIGVFASAVLFLCVREPGRGAMDEPLDTHMTEAPIVGIAEERVRIWPTIVMFFRHPVLILTSLACAVGAFVVYAVLAWTTPYLMRELHMSLQEIAMRYSLVLGLGMGLGTFASGWIVDKLARFGRIWFALVPAIAILAATPLYWGFIQASTWQTALFFLFGPMFLQIFYLAPALAVIQNTVPPAQRTICGALFLLVQNLIGLGLGPTFVGSLSTHLVPEFGVHSLRHAMLWITPFYVAAAALHIIAAWAHLRDVRKSRCLD